ncbi:ImmA/IrrE family metallo-endopeptidase [Leucobacter chromiiresistens]
MSEAQMQMFRDPEAAALIALDAFYHGQSYHAPIDPVAVARSLDINVWSNNLEPELSGMIAKINPGSNTPVDLVVNGNHNPARQRFTAAHELGHYFDVLRVDPELKKTFVHKRDERSACGEFQEEVYANKFAASLLMPRHLVEEHIDRGYSLPRLAASFNVSLQAMTNRLSNLNLSANGA